MSVSDKVLCKSPVAKAVVWLSRSECIFKNLSLEDWIFRNFDFTDTDGLLIWRNKPAVVIGRHQNCYSECDVEYAASNNFDVARRNSGGGTVFHDLNNVNLSFFTTSKRHDRVKNLNLTKTALKKYWNVDVTVSKRHDLLLNDKFKISGTAAKIAAKNSYHHFTLLLDVNERHMKNVLQSSLKVFEESESHLVHNKATQSIRAKVGYLSSILPNITFEQIVPTVVEEFLISYKESDIVTIECPNSDNFIGLNTIENELRSWDWIFGRNPPFSVSELSTDNETVAKLDVDKSVIVDFKCSSSEMTNNWNQLLKIGDRFNISLCNRLFVIDNLKKCLKIV